ncbi:MAG: SET domain-containing protein-lysine N-methyltransferase [Nanoarchaeota archaeon]
MITVPVYVKRSKINGLGVFATREIKKGKIVVRTGSKEHHYTVEQYKNFSKRYRELLDKFGYWEDGFFVYPTDDTKYFNHSCEPNVLNFGNVDIAIRDIKNGEEITYDYKAIPGNRGEFKCNCGSKSCKGIIDRNDKNKKVR